MSTFVFGNLAVSEIASGISAGTTSVTLALGTGASFPSLSTGEQFGVRMTDAATKTNDEIMYATAISGDVVTVARGQEGSTAQSWITGDIFQHCVTAGALSNFVQASANAAPVDAHVQGASIGPGYSDTLTIGFVALSEGYLDVSCFLNLNNVAAAAVTVTLANTKDSQVGQDASTLSQQHKYYVHLNAGDGIFVTVTISGAAGSYPATAGSYAVYASFVGSSL